MSTTSTMNANDLQWTTLYNRLVEYHQQQGHSSVPNTYPADPQLAKWVKKQRYNQIINKLRSDRKELLEQIQFVWSKTDNATFDEQWMQVYQLLVAFHKKHGHTRVTVTGVPKHQKHLAAWVMNQRALQRSGELKSDRKQLLDQIGFVWRTGEHTSLAPLAAAVLDQRWRDRYQDLKQFQQQTGHCRVPNTYPQDPQLAIWVLNQRKFQRAGQLRKDRYNLLNEIGFVWRGNHDPENEEYLTNEDCLKELNDNLEELNDEINKNEMEEVPV